MFNFISISPFTPPGTAGAVSAMQKGMSHEYISKPMGHTTAKHTEIYAIVLNTELDKAMRVFDEEKVAAGG